MVMFLFLLSREGAFVTGPHVNVVTPLPLKAFLSDQRKVWLDQGSSKRKTKTFVGLYGDTSRTVEGQQL